MTISVRSPRVTRWALVGLAVLIAPVTAAPVAARGARPAPLARTIVAEGAAATSIPAAGSQTASPQTSISIIGASASDIGAITVRGSVSGLVPGATRALPEGRGLQFDPAHDLVAGETVTVMSSVAVSGGSGDRFAFEVGRPISVPNSALADEGTSRRSVAADANVAPFATRPDLRPSPVTINVPSTSANEGLFFGGPRATQSSDQGIQVYDETGSLVWFHPVTEPGVVSGDAFVDQYLGVPALFWFEGVAPFGPGNNRGEWIAVDSSYRELGRIRMGNGYRADVHDLYLTDHGTAYVQAYNPLVCTGTGVLTDCIRDAPVLDGVIQEIDLSTGTVLWEWHSLDHVPLSDSVITGTIEVFDYFHLNSVAEDTDGDLIISARNVSADYKIDKSTGELLWTFGGKSPSLAVSGDPDSPKGPDYAHHIRSLGGGDYTYFDNGVARRYSRAAIVHIDQDAQTATYTKIIRHSPELYETSQGTMQTLADGSHLVGWGGAGRVTEYDPSGGVTFEATLAGGTYRQYRFDWTGTPAGRPDVAVAVAGASMEVATSWNGDTRTKQWRILTGSSPATLAPAATVARSGFETTTSVPTDGYVAVQALDGDGKVLRQTTTTATTTWFQSAPAPAEDDSYLPLSGDFAGSRNDDVLFYAPGSGSDHLSVSDGAGGFTSVALPAINGTYDPLVGDFVGDDREEVLFRRNGSATAYLWRFDGAPRTEATTVRSASISVPSTVTSAVVLDNRAAYGGPRDEVLWYAAGRAPDRIDHYGWPGDGALVVTSRAITANGTYRPVAGDFDGNGYADILWYGPGTAPDSMWFLSGNEIRSLDQRSVTTRVNGNYELAVGNFSASADNLELAFVQPGPGADHLWSFTSSGQYRSDVRTSSLTGTPYVLHGGTDRLMMWSTGASPSIWTLDPLGTRPSENEALGDGYQPVIGDFTGAGGTSSVLWYAPGTTPEVLYRGD